jgi:hypothetical protein
MIDLIADRLDLIPVFDRDETWFDVPDPRRVDGRILPVFLDEEGDD